MPNNLYREHLKIRISHAINLAMNAGVIEHSVLKGRLREIFINELFRPFLRQGLDIATGIIVDSRGKQSDQIDVIIYSKDILPEFMKDGEQAIVPIEACLQVFEIKSILNAAEIKDAFKKAESITNLIIQSSGPANVFDALSTANQLKPKLDTIFTLFSFGSDLTNSATNEFERYNKYIPESYYLKTPRLPPIKDVCVVGGGYWFDNKNFISPTPDYDEVISMIVRSVNSMPIWVNSRGYPQFGQYFLNE